MLLVFNPQDLLFGRHDDSSNTSITGDIRSADSSAYMTVPFLRATAVPYREGEAVMRETNEFAPPEVPIIFFVEEGAGGTLDLEDYQHGKLFDDFARKTTVGQTGTVQWDPSTHAQAPQSLTYRLAEIRQMNLAGMAKTFVA